MTIGWKLMSLDQVEKKWNFFPKRARLRGHPLKGSSGSSFLRNSRFRNLGVSTLVTHRKCIVVCSQTIPNIKSNISDALQPKIRPNSIQIQYEFRLRFPFLTNIETNWYGSRCTSPPQICSIDLKPRIWAFHNGFWWSSKFQQKIFGQKKVRSK